MSFLKITDPKKGDLSFLRQGRTSNKTLLERVGDLNTQYELSQLFKPVTEMQKD